MPQSFHIGRDTVWEMSQTLHTQRLQFTRSVNVCGARVYSCLISLRSTFTVQMTVPAVVWHTSYCKVASTNTFWALSLPLSLDFKSAVKFTVHGRLLQKIPFFHPLYPWLINSHLCDQPRRLQKQIARSPHQATRVAVSLFVFNTIFLISFLWSFHFPIQFLEPLLTF